MAKKPKRAAIYARVSTKNGQTPANQIGRLREVADKAGWEVVEEFVDRGISGAKGRDKRPAFDRLCMAATRREIDVVMAWSVDRLPGAAPLPSRHTSPPSPSFCGPAVHLSPCCRASLRKCFSKYGPKVSAL